MARFYIILIGIFFLGTGLIWAGEPDTGPDSATTKFHITVPRKVSQEDQGPRKEKMKQWWKDISSESTKRPQVPLMLSQEKPSEETDLKKDNFYIEKTILPNKATRWKISEAWLRDNDIGAIQAFHVIPERLVIYDDKEMLWIINPATRNPITKRKLKDQESPICFRGVYMALQNFKTAKLSIVDLCTLKRMYTMKIPPYSYPMSISTKGSLILRILGKQENSHETYEAWNLQAQGDRHVIAHNTDFQKVPSFMSSEEGATCYILWEILNKRTLSEAGAHTYIRYSIQFKKVVHTDENPSERVQEFARNGGSPWASTRLYADGCIDTRSDTEKSKQLIYLWQEAYGKPPVKVIDELALECVAAQLAVDPCAQWLAAHICCAKNRKTTVSVLLYDLSKYEHKAKG